MANATGNGQTAASAMRQLKNSIDTAMIVVERIAPYSGATKWDWLCSSTAQSFMMEVVRSARSFFPKKDSGIFLSFSASPTRRTPDST